MSSLSTIPRYRIALVREDHAPQWDTTPIHSPHHIAPLLRSLFDGLDREQVIVCCLDTTHRPIGISLVSVGTLNESLVHPREVFKPAILLNASAIILAHNHPSGDPTPSTEDRRITERLTKAGTLLGITLLDHLVYGNPAVHSILHGPLST
jgi:DNA repair protein RadC